MQTYTRNYKSYPYHDGGLLRPVKRNRRIKSMRLLIICVLILAAFLAKGLLAGDNVPTPVPSLAAASSEAPREKKEEPPKPPPKKLVDTSTLKASIDAINAKYPYNTSVAVVELNSGTMIQTGDTYPYVAASTTKLLTALYYFHKVEAGEVSLDKNIAGKPAREQMRLMINRSDNAAWNQMNTYLSKASLQQFAHQQGLTSFDATKNTMTSSDMARLLVKIHNRELANEVHTALLFSWMQKTSEERFIPPAIPVGVLFYHKAGYLADRVHDVAIVDNGSTPFALVIYSKSYTNGYDNAVGQKIFKQITTQVLSTFSQ